MSPLAENGPLLGMEPCWEGYFSGWRPQEHVKKLVLKIGHRLSQNRVQAVANQGTDTLHWTGNLWIERFTG